MKSIRLKLYQLIMRLVLLPLLLFPFWGWVTAQHNNNSSYVLVPYCCDDKKWGFCDKDLNIVLPCTYDWAEPFVNGLAKVKFNSKVGCINMQGKWVISPEFDQIDWVSNKILRIKKAVGYGDDGTRMFATLYKFGLMDNTGIMLAPVKYDKMDDFSEGMAPVSAEKKWGFINLQGKEVVPLKYDEVMPFSEGLAAVRKDKKWGFVDTTGKEVVKCKYDRVNSFQEGLAVVARDFRYGFIDKNGKEVVPLQFYGAWSFSGGLANVKDGLDGFVDKKGKLVIPLMYDLATSFKDGVALVKNGGKWGAINKLGAQILPPEFDYIYPPSDGLLKVELKGKCGLYDTTGRQLLPVEFDYMGPLRDSLILVKKNEKYGFANTAGKIVIPMVYDVADNFSDGLAIVKIRGKYGFIDKTGNLIIPARYDYAMPFANGRAEVTIKNKKGYIDKTGKEIIPVKFNYILSAENKDYAIVSLDELEYTDATGKEFYVTKNYYVDWTGKEYIKPAVTTGVRYERKEESGVENIFRIMRKENGLERWGLMNASGRVLLSLTYNRIEPVSEGFFVVENSSGWYGYADTSGKIVIPCKFKDARNFSLGLAKVYWDDHSVYINTKGEIVIDPYNYEKVGEYSFGLLPFKKNGKWGVLDNQGNIYIQPVYDWIGNFDYYGIALARYQGKDMVIRFDNTIIYTPPYEGAKITHYSQGKITFEVYDSMGTTEYTARFLPEVLCDAYYEAAYHMYSKGANVWAKNICSQIIEIAPDPITKANAYHLRASSRARLGELDEAYLDMLQACELGSAEACKIIKEIGDL